MWNQMKYFLLFVLAALLIGCMAPYQKKSTWSVGYAETQLDENIFRVSFEGNEFYDEDRTADFTLLRCAELTLENDYKYFAVIDGKSSVKTETTYIPPTYQTYTNAYSYSTTQAVGGGVFTSTTPSANNTIMMFKEKPAGGISYSAEFVKKSIREKYELDKQK